MLSSLECQGLTLVVFLALYNVTGHHFHDVAAAAYNHAGVHLDDGHHLSLRNLLLHFLGEVLVVFPCLNDCLAAWAHRLLVIRQFFDGVVAEAGYVHLVEAFRRLEHRHVPVLSISR